MATRTEKLQLKLEQLAAKLQGLVDQYTATEATFKEVEAELAAIASLDSIVEGDVVEFDIGRGEDAKVLTGQVLAVAETDKGKSLRVFAGTGFEAQTYTLLAKQVRLPQPVTAEAVV